MAARWPKWRFLEITGWLTTVTVTFQLFYCIFGKFMGLCFHNNLGKSSRVFASWLWAAWIFQHLECVYIALWNFCHMVNLIPGIDWAYQILEKLPLGGENTDLMTKYVNFAKPAGKALYQWKFTSFLHFSIICGIFFPRQYKNMFAEVRHLIDSCSKLPYKY